MKSKNALVMKIFNVKNQNGYQKHISVFFEKHVFIIFKAGVSLSTEEARFTSMKIFFRSIFYDNYKQQA